MLSIPFSVSEEMGLDQMCGSNRLYNQQSQAAKNDSQKKCHLAEVALRLTQNKKIYFAI
jgi:hypothetical protein